MRQGVSDDGTVVLGGGVQGLMTAYELACSGDRVTVLDEGGPRPTSWAGGGILSPLHPWRYSDAVNRLAVWSQGVYPTVCAQLTAESGISPEWVRSGMLVLEGDSAAAHDWAHRFNASLETLTADAASTLIPGLAAPKTGAIWMPAVAQVRSPRLMRALRAALAARGVAVCRARATGFKVADGALAALSTTAGEVPVARCVVTAGAWTPSLLAQTGYAPSISPVCGQMLLLAGASLGLKRMVLRDSYYLIPRADGVVLVGSTSEQRGFERSPTAEAYATLRAAAQEIMPAAADCAVIDHWAGLRPGSPEGIPIIGPHPTIAGLYMNAGHFRNGIVLAPASARLLTDLMFGRPPIVDPAPYQPALPTTK